MRYDHFSMLPERAFQPRNGRQGMTLEGGSGGGGGGTQTTYTSNVPEWLRPQTEALLGAATQEYFETQYKPGTPDRYVTQYDSEGNAYQTRIPGTPGKHEIVGVKPYKPFSENAEDYVAGFNPAQQQVFQEGARLKTDDRAYGQASDITRGAASGAVGYGQQGSMFGQQGAGLGQEAAGYGAMYEQMATDPYSVQAYMSPYMQQVVERQKQAAIEDAQRANLAANLSARQGTYGGARQLLAQTQREAALGKQLGDIQASGLQSAFDRAQQAQQFGVTTGLQGLQTGIQGAQTGIQGAQTGLQGMDLTGRMGAQLGNIATAQQAANLQRLEFQRSLGAEQRAREQAIIDQQIQDYAMAQQYPYQQLAAYSGLVRGYATPTTTVSQYKATNPASQLAGTGIQLGGAAQAIGLGGKAGGQVKAYAQGGIAETEDLADMLSIPQLEQSIENNTVPEYIGIPMLEEKVDLAERLKLAQAGIAPDMGYGEPPIADQVMQRANALQGIDSVQRAAGGGMVAFDKGGIARFQNQGIVLGTPKITKQMLEEEARLQKEFIGEDPRIKESAALLKKQNEEGFLDRAMRGLSYVVAGAKVKEGDTDYLQQVMQSEAARRKAIADREMKQLDLQGAEFQRREGIYKSALDRAAKIEAANIAASKGTDMSRFIDNFVASARAKGDKSDEATLKQMGGERYLALYGASQLRGGAAAQQANIAAEKLDVTARQAAEAAVDKQIAAGGNRNIQKEYNKYAREDREANAKSGAQPGDTNYSNKAGAFRERLITDRLNPPAAPSAAAPTSVKPAAPAAAAKPMTTLPPGAKQIGTKGGKPVYQLPDGSQVIQQ